MKVVLIGTTSELHKGGIAQFTRHLADELAERVEILFYSWIQPYPSFLTSHDFRDTVSESKIGKAPARLRLRYMNPLSWWRCAREMCSHNPDMVCLTWNHPIHAPVYIFLTWYVRQFSSAKVVYICHNVLPHEWFPAARFWTRRSLGKADRLIVHGSRMEEETRSLKGPDTEVTTLFLPLHGFFSAEASEEVSDRSSKGPQLLFFGYIRAYKGVDILLRSMPILRERYPDIHLTIAGEVFYNKKSWRDNLHESHEPLRLIKELGIQESVTTHLRYIPNEEVGQFFASADIAVYPYRDATQSGSLTVAYSYGKPVVATAVSSLVDVVAEGRSGYLAQPNDPSALAEAIVRAIENPIPEGEVRAFAETLSWERYVQGLLAEGSTDADSDRFEGGRVTREAI